MQGSFFSWYYMVPIISHAAYFLLFAILAATSVISAEVLGVAIIVNIVFQLVAVLGTADNFVPAMFRLTCIISSLVVMLTNPSIPLMILAVSILTVGLVGFSYLEFRCADLNHSKSAQLKPHLDLERTPSPDIQPRADMRDSLSCQLDGKTREMHQTIDPKKPGSKIELTKNQKNC